MITLAELIYLSTIDTKQLDLMDAFGLDADSCIDLYAELDVMHDKNGTEPMKGPPVGSEELRKKAKELGLIIEIKNVRPMSELIEILKKE